MTSGDPVLEAIRSHPTGVTAAGIALVCGISTCAANRHARRLSRGGAVHRTRDEHGNNKPYTYFATEMKNCRN